MFSQCSRWPTWIHCDVRARGLGAEATRTGLFPAKLGGRGGRRWEFRISVSGGVGTCEGLSHSLSSSSFHIESSRLPLPSSTLLDLALLPWQGLLSLSSSGQNLDACLSLMWFSLGPCLFWIKVVTFVVNVRFPGIGSGYGHDWTVLTQKKWSYLSF